MPAMPHQRPTGPTAYVQILGQDQPTFGAVHYETDGYSPTTVYTQAHADLLNQRQGITPEIAEAFLMGSMFGWHIPGAKAAHDFMAAKTAAEDDTTKPPFVALAEHQAAASVWSLMPGQECPACGKTADTVAPCHSMAAAAPKGWDVAETSTEDGQGPRARGDDGKPVGWLALEAAARQIALSVGQLDGHALRAGNHPPLLIPACDLAELCRILDHMEQTRRALAS